MHNFFIADAHLKRPDDENYRALLAFLDALPDDTDTLFILGDLFEFRVGGTGNAFDDHAPAMERLLALAGSGIRVVWLEGNHDFNLGAANGPLEIHPGPVALHLDGKRVYLCHGDQVNRCDYGYRLLRGVLRSRPLKLLMGLAPHYVVSRIASLLGENSSRKHAGRRSKWDYPALLRQFAVDRCRDGYEVMISGHFHLPFLEATPGERTCTLVSLGDWISQFSYAEWRNGEVFLKTFRSQEGDSPNSLR